MSAATAVALSASGCTVKSDNPDGGTLLQISSTGGFAGGYDPSHVDQRIELAGVDLTSIGSDQQIVQNLLNNGKLITD